MTYTDIYGLKCHLTSSDASRLPLLIWVDDKLNLDPTPAMISEAWNRNIHVVQLTTTFAAKDWINDNIGT